MKNKEITKMVGMSCAPINKQCSEFQKPEMVNKTNIRIPKKYQERIREIYHDSDGYWVYLNKGWYSDDYGLHTIHQDTQKEVLDMIRWTEPCDCDYCKGLEKGLRGGNSYDKD